MACQCWQLVLLALVLALPAARMSGRALARDTSSPGALPFQATEPSDTCTSLRKFPHSRCSPWHGRSCVIIVASICLQAPRRL